MLAFVEEGKPENPEKTLGARTRTNNKLNQHMTPGPHTLVGGERSHHCAIPAPLPVYQVGEQVTLRLLAFALAFAFTCEPAVTFNHKIICRQFKGKVSKLPKPQLVLTLT